MCLLCIVSLIATATHMYIRSKGPWTEKALAYLTTRKCILNVLKPRTPQKLTNLQKRLERWKICSDSKILTNYTYSNLTFNLSTTAMNK